MLTQNDPRYSRVARTIDDFMTIDLTGVGLIGPIYDAVQRRQPGPVCMGAAEIIARALGGRGGPVLIATGFPEGGGVPETDGPVGAALLARALFLGFGVESVIVVDEDWEAMMRATCLGAGLSPMPFPGSGVIEPIAFLRPVYIRTVPKDAEGCRRISDELLERTRPRLVMAIERPGCNANGLYHGLGGRPLDGMVGDLDYLFRTAKELGLPFIGIGDGGNELGMGVIAEDLPAFSPKAADCGIPGRGGVAAATAATHLVVANVSNWGATGIIAALSALLQNPVLFHDPELERRCIEQCVAGGGVDGMFMAPEPAVDGISAREWEGLIRALRGAVRRALGHVVNWKGDQGDWRQVK
jgi:D-glutamate cyclase